MQEIIAVVFLDIALIVTVARLLGVAIRRLRQPSVVAEILAALTLGPSLLGALPGDLTSVLFPEDVRPFLSVIAALGLTIYMFVVGLELDLTLIRGKGRAAGTISICSVTLPFVMGAGLAIWLHRRHGTVDGVDVELLPFVLFIGAAMSVTAFPVLARILAERGIQRTPTGALALACAAVDDVLAWIMLAAVLAVVRSSGGIDLLLMLAESVLFTLVMFRLVKPRLRVLVDRHERAGRLTADVFSVVLVGVLVSSYITDKIGIHAIFGAFLFGAVMPRKGAERLSHEVIERVEQVTVLLLLPVFFVVTGLNVDVTALGRTGVLELLVVVVVACVGKFVGAAAAARGLRIRPRRAASIGILMNTRGLTELVVLNIGLAVGILDEQLFTVMVLMAIITTVITEPLLRLVYPDRLVARDVAEAERAALGLTAEHRVLLLVGDEDSASVVDVAVALLGRHEDSELVISRVEPRPVQAPEVGAGLTSDLLTMVTSMELTEELSKRAVKQGAAVHVHSQLARDPVHAAAVLAESVEADVVVVSARSRFPAASLSGAGARVVITVDMPGNGAATAEAEAVRRVVVPVSTSEDGAAAVEQAVRAAEWLRVPVMLIGGPDRRTARRIAALERRINAAGVQVAAVARGLDPGPGSGSLIVVGSSGNAPELAASTPEEELGGAQAGTSAVLRVRGTAHENAERLDAMLSRRSDTVSATDHDS